MQRRRPTYDHLLKLIIIGDSSVGKTCLLLRFADDNFPSNYMPTIGIDFKIKMVQIQNQKIKLQVWDTAGQEKFRTITQTYYKGAMGIILVYDCTDKQSFANIQTWMTQIETHSSEGVIKTLVGNKCDLPNQVVSYQQGVELAQQYGMTFFQASAKSGISVGELFTDIAERILVNKGVNNTKGFSIKEEKQDENTNDGCC